MKTSITKLQYSLLIIANILIIPSTLAACPSGHIRESGTKKFYHHSTLYDTFDDARAACDPGTSLATFETQDEVDKIFEIVVIQDDKCYTALYNPSSKSCFNKNNCKTRVAFYPGTDSIGTTFINSIEAASDKLYLVFEKDPKVTPSDGGDDACAICMCDEATATTTTTTSTPTTTTTTSTTSTTTTTTTTTSTTTTSSMTTTTTTTTTTSTITTTSTTTTTTTTATTTTITTTFTTTTTTMTSTSTTTTTTTTTHSLTTTTTTATITTTSTTTTTTTTTTTGIVCHSTLLPTILEANSAPTPHSQFSEGDQIA